MILNADALHIPLADKTVQTCVTSPPYYGLRDYGTAIWEGGDPECDHKIDNSNAQLSSGLEGFKRNVGNALAGYRSTCRKCGAIRIDKQIGLEETPEAYVEKMVQVFREVWRVMKDDGTLWLNLGDSYASATPCDRRNVIGNGSPDETVQRKSRLIGDLKEKDLMGIPWMVAFALRADGWYLRSDIIWHKPNPMPESVRDRPTKSHEYIFLLSKSPRYFYDAEAIAEQSQASEESKARAKYPRYRKANKRDKDSGKPDYFTDPSSGYWPETRNRRSVWEVATMPYSGAHFATFPPKLIEPCILAGSREGDIVLDPFSGSGTTGQVAIQYRRRYVGLELNMEYIELSKVRTTTDVMLPNFLP